MSGIGLKLLFFTSSARSAYTARFLPLILVEQGLTDSEVGVVLSSAYISIIILSPVLSIIADYKNSRYAFTQIAYITTGIVVLGFIAPYYWFGITNTNGLFVIYLVLMIIYSFPNEIITPFVDSLAMIKLDNNKEVYGRYRSFGALGWGGMHVIVGLLLEYLFELHWLLYLYSFITIFIAIILYFTFSHKYINNYKTTIKLPSYDSTNLISDDNNDNNNDITNKEEDTYFNVIKYVFTSKYGIAIYLLGFTFGGGWLAVQSLLFVYLTSLSNDDENVSYLLLGSSVGVSVIFEIPFLYLSDFFIRKIGYRWMIIIGLIIYCFRLVSYTLIDYDTIWLLPFIEILQGFTFGLLHVPLVNIPSLLFPNKMQTTAQGLMGCIRYGVAPFIFIFCGGFIMDELGGEWFYRIITGIVVITTIIFYFLTYGIDIELNSKPFKTHQKSDIISHENDPI